jgi:photoactive yellow protein
VAAFASAARLTTKKRGELGKQTFMASPVIDFSAPDLAAQVECLNQAELDELPFGVVLLDRAGTVMFYSATEARLSGYGMMPLGKNFFEAGRNPRNGDLRYRIMGAMEKGKVDLEFGWIGDLANPQRDLCIRAQSSSQGGVWLFIDRD